MLGSLARQEGDREEAARQYEAARGDLDGMPFSDSVSAAMLLTEMGLLAVASGDLASAHRHLEKAFALATEAPEALLVAMVGVGVARLTLRRGGARKAGEVLGAAHVLRGAPDAFNPDVARLIGDLRDELGERDHDSVYAAGRALDRADALALIEAQLRAAAGEALG
jgi:ATP/maltotriose-dependent transcriptional regulator MalT